MWHVYILKCADGSFYVGHTCHLRDRVAGHNTGRGAIWTTRRCPVALVYQETYELEADAVAREKQIKRWSKAKKQALMNRDFNALRGLSKRQC
jgi:predicted GIY-YIG superfamily endonuclease